MYGVEADDEEGGADADAHAAQVRADVGDEAEEDVHGKCEVRRLKCVGAIVNWSGLRPVVHRPWSPVFLRVDNLVCGYDFNALLLPFIYQAVPAFGVDGLCGVQDELYGRCVAV